MALISNIIFFLFGILLTIIIIYLYYVYVHKAKISEETEELKEKLHGNSGWLINFGDKTGHLLYRVADIDGLDLGGATRIKAFPRDIVVKDGRPIHDPNKIDNILIPSGSLINAPSGTYSQLPFYISLPYRPEDINDNDPIAELIRPKVIFNKIIRDVINAMSKQKLTEAEMIKQVNSKEMMNHAFKQYQNMLHGLWQTTTQQQYEKTKAKI